MKLTLKYVKGHVHSLCNQLVVEVEQVTTSPHSKHAEKCFLDHLLIDIIHEFLHSSNTSIQMLIKVSNIYRK